MLPFYAERFTAVEINSTFYGMPTAKALGGGAAAPPPRFVFVLKAPRRITHDQRLVGSDEPLTYFRDTARTLGEKLGPLFFQLPPNFRKDTTRLGDLLAMLPRGERHAFEFRHHSWFDDGVYALLRAWNAALCVADTERGTTPLVATADFGYVRLRDAQYTDAELGEWAARATASGRPATSPPCCARLASAPSTPPATRVLSPSPRASAWARATSSPWPRPRRAPSPSEPTGRPSAAPPTAWSGATSSSSATGSPRPTSAGTSTPTSTCAAGSCWRSAASRAGPIRRARSRPPTWPATGSSARRCGRRGRTGRARSCSCRAPRARRTGSRRSAPPAPSTWSRRPSLGRRPTRCWRPRASGSPPPRTAR